MIKLAVVEEYSISQDNYEKELQGSVSNLKGVFFDKFFAVGNGQLIVQASTLTDINSEEGDELIVFSLKNSNTQSRNISSLIGPKSVESSTDIFGGWACHKIENSLIFTSGSNKAVLFPMLGFGAPKNLEVENPFDRSPNQYGHPIFIRPNAYKKAASDNCTLPILVTDGSRTRYLSYLVLEPEKHAVRWQTKPTYQQKSIFSHLLKISKPKTIPNHNTLTRIRTADLPGGALDVILDSFMLRKGNIFIYSKGENEAPTPKGGQSFSAIIEVAPDGRIISLPWYQDHRLHDDQRKRGHFGQFTTSQSYCILSSIYKSTDEWRGKQRLFDLNSNELLPVRLPKGYAQFEIVDHNLNDFWLKKKTPSGFQKSVEIVRCERV